MLDNVISNMLMESMARMKQNDPKVQAALANSKQELVRSIEKLEFAQHEKDKPL